jgi:hypothetical protein
MVGKWRSLVARVCETCGAEFRVQHQSAVRPRGGRYCSRACNPRFREVAQRQVALPIGPKRARIDVTCAGCGLPFTTRVKNVARGGGRFCSRQCNPAYRPRLLPGEKYRRHNLSRTYGMSLEDFSRMATAQRGRCAICESLPDGPHGVLVVDHDHMTDNVRELLCNNCNSAIGFLRDDPVRAARLSAYLLKHDPNDDDVAHAVALLQARGEVL